MYIKFIKFFIVFDRLNIITRYINSFTFLEIVNYKLRRRILDYLR